MKNETNEIESDEQQAYQDMRADLESGECYTINEHDQVFCHGKYLGLFLNADETFEAIRKDMERRQFWPNIYRVNDHGNVDLLDHSGNIVESWV